MTNTKMTLVDWLDDLCVRFIVNLPNEELQSVERICFQIEEAQWFYEDFIRPLDPNSLPSMHLRKFSQLMFQHCPLFSAYSEELHQQAYEQFLAYKTRVPVRGAIMLNHDMTHAVLVKGWKKGAKWSFPRGKINKEETDLDCAVREVYEETGFDLTQTDLVLPEEEMKKITVTMREQSMMLYVFRGVPMDTHFEPRTRKEISKIDWYKLTDLPTLRRKNQAPQQGTGQDLIKESSFYMVAPFLGPLKAWIKQQHKLDRQRLRNSAQIVPHVAAIITDDEVELYDNAAGDTATRQDAPPDASFADIIAKLGRSHRPSDALPELSEQPQTQQSTDPAVELKRLLSVGMSVRSPPVEAPPGPQPQANALLALFQQGRTKSSTPTHGSVPNIPFDQNMPPPMQPTPPHGQHQQHQSRPFQPGNVPPQQSFPLSIQQGHPLLGPQPGFGNVPQASLPQNLRHHEQQLDPMFPAVHSPVRQPLGQQLAPSFQLNTTNLASRPQFAQTSDPLALDERRSGPVVPPASKLPPPKMNAHTLGLLNAFKTSSSQAPASPMASQSTVNIQDSPSTQYARQHVSITQHHQPNELSSPQFQSPPMNIQPAQPKPRSAHQDSLLTLFRATPPISSPEPAELSALPTTPGYVAAQPSTRSIEVPHIASHGTLHVQPHSGGITSATVRAPVNAPDFETMKKHTQQNVSGSSRGPSPGSFAPQQVLRRDQPRMIVQSPSEIPQANAASHVLPKAQSPQHSTFQPQILKRPNQQSNVAPIAAPTAHSMSLLEMFKSPSPQLSASQSLPSARSPAPSTTHTNSERKESLPSEQKNTLLALFGKPSPKPEGSVVAASPQSTSRSPLPPTPKTTMSGVVSPVSPLPEKGSHTASPSDPTARSRISSIGDGQPPSVAIPPTSHPSQYVDNAHNNLGNGLGKQSRVVPDSKSPVDKNFLLGFLEDVARRGR